MPDEDGNDGVETDDLPETSLHAHGSGIEEENERPREENAEGNILDDHEDDADDVTTTGGATSGGPPSEDVSDQPSENADDDR